eukprot:gene6622-12158_t
MVCKAKFHVDHALSCQIGGFVTLRHNEMSDLTVDLLPTVCKDVCNEPCLQQSENGVELRAEVSARGFWQRMQRAFVDVRPRNYSINPSICSVLSTSNRENGNRRCMLLDNDEIQPVFIWTFFLHYGQLVFVSHFPVFDVENFKQR